MDIPAGLLPGHYLWFAVLLHALLLVLAAGTAPWSKLRDSEALHGYTGAIVAVMVLWMLRGGIQPGLDYHLPGATALCLMFEWQFALFAASTVLAAATWHGAAGWEAFGVNALVTGAVSVIMARLLYFAQRRLPHNFFVYVFINAFLAGARVAIQGLAALRRCRISELSR